MSKDRGGCYRGFPSEALPRTTRQQADNRFYERRALGSKDRGGCYRGFPPEAPPRSLLVDGHRMQTQTMFARC